MKANDVILSLPTTDIAFSISNLRGSSEMLNIPETVKAARQVYKAIQDDSI